jgi:CRP-like cAMP-binding protein
MLFKYQNRFFASLSTADWQRWAPELNYVQLFSEQAILERGAQITHIYFPISVIFSYISLMRDGRTVEIASIGNEGMIGISSLLGMNEAPYRCIVQRPGAAYKVSASFVKREFEQSTAFHLLTLRYTHALMTLISQVSACARLHSLEHQVSRWFLISLDRTGGADAFITQEQLANLMGVRRERIAKAFTNLRIGDLIQFSRGRVHINQRTDLQLYTCECYKLINKAFTDLIP